MFKIIGIDPGTNFVGLCIMTINSKDFSIAKIESSVIDVSKVESRQPLNNNLVCRLGKLSSMIHNVLYTYKPMAIGIESPFINPRRPGSVIPLAQSLQVIEYSMYMYNPNIPIGKYPPSTIKNMVKAHGAAKKEPVLEAVLKIKEIASRIDLVSKTDHEIDAIAIAYCVLNDIKNNPLILLH